MKLSVTFKVKNPEFNKEYADQYHFGKESENNTKDLWSKSYSLNVEIDKFTFSENDAFHLFGYLENGEKIDEKIPNMDLLKCYFSKEKNDEFEILGASSSLIQRTHEIYNKKTNRLYFYFYLKPDLEYLEITDGIYVNIEDIPKQMVIN